MLRPQIETQGFEFWRGALSPATVADLIAALESMGPTGGAYGLRNLLRRSAHVRKIGAALRNQFSARAPFRPAACSSTNCRAPTGWSVGTRTSRSRSASIDMKGFGAWTIKEGVPHVQPPVDVLSEMLTLRLHLDRTEAENGALIVPAGHTDHGSTPRRLGRPGRR